MERDELRLKCVEIAVRGCPNNHDEAVSRADKYYKFIKAPDQPAEEKKSAGNAKQSS